jgi:hypothetical protein
VLEIVAVAVVTAITRHFTASVSSMRSTTEIRDISPQRVDVGQTQNQVLAGEAEPMGTLQVLMSVVML